MADETDMLKQRVLRNHLAELNQTGAIAKPPKERGYLDADGNATPLGSEFLVLSDAGLIGDDGNLTPDGELYSMNHRDSLDAPPDIYQKREKLGLNQIDKESGDQGGFWKMIGDFVTEGVPRLAETAYNSIISEEPIHRPRLLEEIGAKPTQPRASATRTPEEQANAVAESITGGVLASEPLAAGAVYGIQQLAAEVQGKTDEAYAAKQEWERHNAEISELKGAEMMQYLTGADQYLKAREQLVARDGEEAVRKNEEFDRLAGNFILDPNNVLSLGAGKLATSTTAAAARMTLNAEKLAMKAKVLRMGELAAKTERATLEAGTARAKTIATNALERAKAFRDVGNEAQAIRYEATAAQLGERAAPALQRLQELSATEARLGEEIAAIAKKAGVAETILSVNEKIAAIRQMPAQAVGGVVESVGTGLVKTDAFLSNAADTLGITGLYQATRSLPGRLGAAATGAMTGFVPAVIPQALASGPLLQSIGNFTKILGKELIAERGSVPFWRRVANNSTISKTQRFLAHRADELTLGGRIPEVGARVAKGTVAAYPMNLALNVLADPDHDLGNAASSALGPSLVFGGGTSGAGAIFRGTKAKMKSVRMADQINFMRNLTEDHLSGFSGMSTGAKRAVATYGAAFPNLNWNFKHDGPNHYDAVTNTANINPASNNPLRALVGHEVLHYVTIRNQMQPAIHAMLLGDSITPGLVRHTDGTLDPEFQKFHDAYQSRMDSAGLERIPLEKVAEEYFNENTVDHLMGMVESGELSRMAGRTQAGRKINALIEATIPRVPILRDFFFRTGGAMEAGGRHVMGNGLLADGIRELPEARAMMRKLVRSSAGEAAMANGAVKVNDADGPGAKLPVAKGDPIIDAFHSILEVDANGIPLKDAQGNHIALSRAKDQARQTAGLVITEAQTRRVQNGYLPGEGEMKKMDDGSWYGDFLDKPLIDALAAKGILNSKQIAIIRNISAATKSGIGHRFLITNHPALIKSHKGKIRYDSIAATLRESVPLGFRVTQKGNIVVQLMSVTQLDHNITTRAASKRGKALYDGNTEAIKQDISAMMDIHKNGYEGDRLNQKTDKFYQEKYGPATWEDRKNFINTIFGLMTKEQKEKNPMFLSDGVTSAKDHVYRTYRLDRISKAIKMDGTPLPFGYTHVKANYLPEGVTE